MSKLRVAFLVVIFSLVAFAPFAVGAANATFFGPLIPTECRCDGSNGQPKSAPGWGCVLQILQNAMNLGISISIIVATLIIAYAGFLWILSPTNAENKQKGRTLLLNAVIGMAIVLSAWLVIDFFMKTLYNEGTFGPWNSILTKQGDAGYCLEATQMTSKSGLPSTGGTTSTSTSTNSCIPTTTNGLNVASAIGYLNSHTVPIPGNGQCAKAVRLALLAGGLNAFSAGGTDAKNYGPRLTAARFTSLGSSDPSPIAGDIVVIQNYPGGSNAGHIAMYDGTRWVSDFVQADFWGGPGYRSYQPSHQFYRAPSASSGAASCTNTGGVTTSTTNVTPTTAVATTTATTTAGTSGWDPAAAVRKLLAQAQSTVAQESFLCAQYVRQAIAAGGLTYFNTPQVSYANQYDTKGILTKGGFVLVDSGVTTLNLQWHDAQSGDVIVFQPVCGNSSSTADVDCRNTQTGTTPVATTDPEHLLTEHPHGHMAMFADLSAIRATGSNPDICLNGDQVGGCWASLWLQDYPWSFGDYVFAGARYAIYRHP